MVEQEQTIDEIGSTFSIQGLDLNYAGVIIGPSVKYRDGQIVFDKSCSANKKVTQKKNIARRFERILFRYAFEK